MTFEKLKSAFIFTNTRYRIGKFPISSFTKYYPRKRLFILLLNQWNIFSYTACRYDA